MKDRKQEGKLLHRNKTFHMSLLYSFACADSSFHPPCYNSFIWLFALLWFWLVVGFFCLFKESMQVKQRLFL